MATKVCIIGRGLSGSFAALKAVNSGAETTVLYKGLGSTALSNGLISFATARSNVPIKRALEILLKHRPNHPYHHLEDPLGAILDTKDIFTQLLGDIYSEFPNSESIASHYPNDLGTFTRADIALKSFWTYQGTQKIGIIKLPAFPLFRSDYLAESFNTFQPDSTDKSSFEVVEVNFDKNGKIFKNAADLARFLDNDENIEKLATNINHQNIGNIDCLLMPAVLGFKRFDVAEKLSALVGTTVREVCPTQNSISGLKVAAYLKDKLSEKGVNFIHAESTGFKGENKVESITVKENNIMADSFILAGGKFIGGGIVCNSKHYTEPVFNSPVSIGQKLLKDVFIGRLTDVKFDAGQLFSEAGLTVNKDFKVTDMFQNIHLDNLYATGQILQGFDPFIDGCTQGVDIVSGTVAATKAAEVRS